METNTIPTTYESFLTALAEGGWTQEQITGDVDQPQALEYLLTAVGTAQAEEWILTAMEEGRFDESEIAGDVVSAENGVVASEEIATLEDKPAVGNVAPQKELLGGNVNVVVNEDVGCPPAPKVNSERLQSAINDLVFQHGANLPRRSDVMELLSGTGVDYYDLTPEAMDKAEQYAREKVREKTVAQAKRIRTTKLECLSPGSKFRLPDHSVRGNHEGVVCTLLELNTSEAKVEINEGGRTTAVRWSPATEVVFLGNQGEKPNKESEEERTMATAVADEEQVLEVTEKTARDLFVEMGMSEDKVADWDLAMVSKKLNRLPNMLESLNEPESKEGRKLVKKVVDAIQEGHKISVIGEDEDDDEEEEEEVKTKTKPSAEGNGVHKRRGRPPKDKSSKPEKKTRPSSGSGEGTDKFGSRLGSDRAKLNACLSKKPKSLKKLVEEAGLDSLFFRKHLKGLVEKGMVKQTDDGFALA